MTAIRLLHVDDEPDIREVVEISLGLDPDFEVQSCPSGRDALVMAAEWEPDLVLLDVMMPEMDGLTTLAHLRDNPRTTDIPVLFMTARVQAHEIERFRAIGAQGVIAKPFEPLTLAASIKRHIQLADVQIDPRRLFLNRARDEVAALESYKAALSDRTQAATAIEHVEIDCALDRRRCSNRVRGHRRQGAEAGAGAGGTIGRQGDDDGRDRGHRCALRSRRAQIGQQHWPCHVAISAAGRDHAFSSAACISDRAMSRNARMASRTFSHSPGVSPRPARSGSIRICSTQRA